LNFVLARLDHALHVCGGLGFEFCVSAFKSSAPRSPLTSYRTPNSLSYRLEAYASAPEGAHQQWGGSPHRTEHWLSVAEGNCVAERRGGANDQSIIKKMINSIRPDALASLLVYGEAQNGSRPGKGERQLRDLTCGQSSERRDRSAWGGWR